MHEIAYRHALHFGHALHVGGAQGGFDHARGGAAAPVAVAVGQQAQVGGILERQFAHAGGNVVHVRPAVGAVEVGEHLAAVDALPYEALEGEFVLLVPADLGCVEVFYLAPPHDLRDVGVVAEGIGQPEAIRRVIEVFAGELLPFQELAHHQLARGDVAVALHIYAAVWLVAPLGHALLHLRENRGIVIFHPF